MPPAQLEPLPQAEASSPAAIDPDNPPWGLFAAVTAWIASIALLFVMQLLAVLGYFLSKYSLADLTNFRVLVEADKSALIFVSVLAVIPAHLATLFVIWALVTNFGRWPFWRPLGWSFSPRVGLGMSVVIALVMLVIGVGITNLIHGDKTQLDQIIASSRAARFATAFLATATAPLIEEMVYRGMLYPALRRLTGALWAVIAVSVLFTFVHVFQYANNLGVITAIALLSLTLTATRAISGRLLPCFIIHLIFNGVQAASLLAEPYLRPMIEKNNAQAAAVVAALLDPALRFFY